VVAWVIIACIGGAALASIPPLIAAGRYVSSFYFLLVVLGLGALARTNPMSADHLSIFGYLTGGLLLWLWCVWLDVRNFFLLLCSCAATFGAFGCLISLGIGERVMILGTLAALNTLLSSDLLD